MRFKTLSFIASAFCLSACSASPPTQPTTDPAIGTYTLVQVAGATLPARQSSTTVVTDGTLFIGQDGTYSSAVHQSVTVNGSTTITLTGLPNGSWSRVADRLLHLVPVSGEQLTIDAFADLPNLYFDVAGVTYGYVKRQ